MQVSATVICSWFNLIIFIIILYFKASQIDIYSKNRWEENLD